MNRPKRGFTLIELLVVIAILVMLMTLLLPALIKAWMSFKVTRVRGQIGNLTNACDAYHDIYSNFPGTVENPPGTGLTAGTPTYLSGCQNLRLSLIGCSRVKATMAYKGELAGPSEDIDNYASPAVRRYEPFYKHAPDELVPHNKVYSRDATQDSKYGAIEVIVDSQLSPPRPLLYYRSAKTVTSSVKASNFKMDSTSTYYITRAFLFEFDDNAVYCQSGESKAQTLSTSSGYFSVSKDELGSWIGNVSKSTGFIIVSAGLDRIYFTDDDVTSFAR